MNIQELSSRYQLFLEYLYNSLLSLLYFVGIKKWKYHNFKLKNGINYLIREAPFSKVGSDQLVIDEVWNKQVYHFDSSLEDKDLITIIDLGAHIGVFSTFMAHKYENARIFSFEPFPDNYKLLQENIKRNGLNNQISTFNLAVSDSNQDLELHIDLQNSGGNSIYRKVGKAIKVKCITLDEVFKNNKIDYCHVLKIDIEGAEYSVLYNTSSETLKKIGHIMMEHHEVFKKDYNPSSLKSFLEKNGFSVKIEGSYLYADNTPL